MLSGTYIFLLEFNDSEWLSIVGSM